LPEADVPPAGLPPAERPPAAPPIERSPFGPTAPPMEHPLPGWAAPPEPVPVAERIRQARKPLLVAAVALFLAGMVTTILLVPRLTGGPRTEAVAMPGAGADGTSVTGRLDGLTAASLDLVDGAGDVEMRAEDLGDDLFRVDTPDGSGVTPRVDRDGGALRLHLPPGVHGGPAAVDIVLNATVRWTLRVAGGADRTRIDLTGVRVDAVDLAGGAKTIDLTLPAPSGAVPVRMTGGVDQFLVRLPGATPVRVQVQSGAGQVTLAGATHRGIAPGRSFTANGWAAGAAGIDLLAVAGMSALTVAPI
jgi:hypothetical protein